MIITLVNEFGKKKLDFKSGYSGSHLFKNTDLDQYPAFFRHTDPDKDQIK